MKDNWKYFKNHHGAGCLLDIRGEGPRDHYSFVFEKAGRFIKITAVWEYFDRSDYALLPANKLDGATLGDFSSYSDAALRFFASALEDAGITEDNLGEFLEAGRKILQR